MLDWIFVVIAIAAGGADAKQPSDVTQTALQSYEAEPQQPTGKFTTATEVKPILSATKANWVAVREYDGQDLIYVSHLFAWRCGLLQLRYAVNGAEMRDWPLPPCLTDTATPNAIRVEDGLPYEAFGLGSVETLSIEILYDDLTRDRADYSRRDILMP